jgi:hypothetical protein
MKLARGPFAERTRSIWPRGPVFYGQALQNADWTAVRTVNSIHERALAAPIPASILPGDRSVVELGDVVRLTPGDGSLPVFRRNGRPAEMVTAELAGAFEAPLYGMIAVSRAIQHADRGGLPKPVFHLQWQSKGTAAPALPWDGEWEVTWVTFRDMGAAFIVVLR